MTRLGTTFGDRAGGSVSRVGEQGDEWMGMGGPNHVFVGGVPDF